VTTIEQRLNYVARKLRINENKEFPGYISGEEQLCVNISKTIGDTWTLHAEPDSI